METDGTTATATSLHPATTLGPVTLTVGDLERSAAFYETAIGLRIVARSADAVHLGGEDGAPLVELVGRPDAPPRPLRTTGLFHVAVLYPTRELLADALRRVLEAGIGLDGASDHGVSEALYLRDPDGNGVELYWDRPREEWPQPADGEAVGMYTAPLDLRSLLALAR